MKREILRQFFLEVQQEFTQWLSQGPWATYLLKQKSPSPLPTTFTLAIPKGLKRILAPGDGHCFYYSVALSLHGQDIKNDRQKLLFHAKNLRQLTADHLLKFRDNFLPFLYIEGNNVDINQAEAFQLRINGILDNEWADDIEITALTKALQRPIVIIQHNDIVMHLPDHNQTYSNNPPIFVYYNLETGHYDALLPEAGSNPKDILTELEKKSHSDLNSNKQIINSPNEYLQKNLSNLRYGNNTNLQTWVECGYTLCELTNLSRQLLEQNSVDPIITNTSQLVLFLKNRWTRIKNTNLAYPHNTIIASNIYCTQLAKLLAKSLTTNNHLTSAHELLMPTLTELEHNVTTTDLQAEDIPHSAFVLTDDNTGYIEVMPCIEMSIDDGILKKQHQLTSEPIPLSISESNRIASHSKEGKDYLNAVRNYRNYKNSPKFKSLYEELERLRTSIQNADVRHRGKELEAHQSVNAAIVRFSTYLSDLPLEIRNKLFAAKTNNDKTFGYIWFQRLRADASLNTDGSVDTCAQITSDLLTHLLSNPQNKWLDQKWIRKSEEQKAEQAKKALETTIEKGCILNTGYGAEGDQLLFERIRTNNVEIQDFILQHLCIIFLSSETENIDAPDPIFVANLLSFLNNNLTEKFYARIKNQLHAILFFYKHAQILLTAAGKYQEIENQIKAYFINLGFDQPNNQQAFYDFLITLRNIKPNLRNQVWQLIKNEAIKTRLLYLSENDIKEKLNFSPQASVQRLLLLLSILEEQEQIALLNSFGLNYDLLILNLLQNSTEQRQLFLATLLTNKHPIFTKNKFIFLVCAQQIAGINDLCEILTKLATLSLDQIKMREQNIVDILNNFDIAWFIKNIKTPNDLISLIKWFPISTRLRFIQTLYNLEEFDKFVTKPQYLYELLENLNKVDRTDFLLRCGKLYIELFFKTTDWAFKLLRLIPDAAFNYFLKQIKQTHASAMIKKACVNSNKTILILSMLNAIPGKYRAKFLQTIEYQINNLQDFFNIFAIIPEENRSEFFQNQPDDWLFKNIKNPDTFINIIDQIPENEHPVIVSRCKFILRQLLKEPNYIAQLLPKLKKINLTELITITPSHSCIIINLLQTIQEKPAEQMSLLHCFDCFGLNKLIKTPEILCKIIHLLSEKNKIALLTFFKQKYQEDFLKIFNDQKGFFIWFQQFPSIHLRNELLKLCSPEMLKNIFPTIDFLRKYLLSVEQVTKMTIMLQLDDEYFKTQLKNIEKLMLLLDCIPQKLRLEFLQKKVGIKTLSKIIVTSADYQNFSTYLPQNILEHDMLFSNRLNLLKHIIHTEEALSEPEQCCCCIPTTPSIILFGKKTSDPKHKIKINVEMLKNTAMDNDGLTLSEIKTMEQSVVKMQQCLC